MLSNLKGGCGKTSNSVLFAYRLARMGYKTLVCDLDPQSNASQLLERTYYAQHGKEIRIHKTMMAAIADNDLEDSIVKIMPNLYMIPSYPDFYNYPDYLNQMTWKRKNFSTARRQQISYFSRLIDPIVNKRNFDFEIDDVPPTIDRFVQSSLYHIDDIVIILQTQQRAYDSAKFFIQYLQRFYDINRKRNAKFDFNILGVLPVIMKKRAIIDNSIMDEATKLFGKDNIFNTVIHYMERLKRYDTQGITEVGVTKWSDFHDTKVAKIYTNLTAEILRRIGVSSLEIDQRLKLMRGAIK